MYYTDFYGWNITVQDDFNSAQYAAFYCIITANAVQSIGCFIVFIVMQPRAYDTLRLVLGFQPAAVSEPQQSDRSTLEQQSSSFLASIDLTDDDVLYSLLSPPSEVFDVTSPEFGSTLDDSLMFPSNRY